MPINYGDYAGAQNAGQIDETTGAYAPKYPEFSARSPFGGLTQYEAEQRAAILAAADPAQAADPEFVFNYLNRTASLDENAYAESTAQTAGFMNVSRVAGDLMGYYQDYEDKEPNRELVDTLQKRWNALSEAEQGLLRDAWGIQAPKERFPEPEKPDNSIWGKIKRGADVAWDHTLGQAHHAGAVALGKTLEIASVPGQKVEQAFTAFSIVDDYGWGGAWAEAGRAHGEGTYQKHTWDEVDEAVGGDKLLKNLAYEYSLVATQGMVDPSETIHKVLREHLKISDDTDLAVIAADPEYNAEFIRLYGELTTEGTGTHTAAQNFLHSKISFGRVVATMFGIKDNGPGMDWWSPFDMVSGFFDMSASLITDPLNYVGIGEARSAVRFGQAFNTAAKGTNAFSDMNSFRTAWQAAKPVFRAERNLFDPRAAKIGDEVRNAVTGGAIKTVDDFEPAVKSRVFRDWKKGFDEAGKATPYLDEALKELHEKFGNNGFAKFAALVMDTFDRDIVGPEDITALVKVLEGTGSHRLARNVWHFKHADSVLRGTAKVDDAARYAAEVGSFWDAKTLRRIAADSTGRHGRMAQDAAAKAEEAIRRTSDIVAAQLGSVASTGGIRTADDFFALFDSTSELINVGWKQMSRGQLGRAAFRRGERGLTQLPTLNTKGLWKMKQKLRGQAKLDDWMTAGGKLQMRMDAGDFDDASKFRLFTAEAATILRSKSAQTINQFLQQLPRSGVISLNSEEGMENLRRMLAFSLDNHTSQKIVSEVMMASGMGARREIVQEATRAMMLKYGIDSDTIDEFINGWSRAADGTITEQKIYSMFGDDETLQGVRRATSGWQLSDDLIAIPSYRDLNRKLDELTAFRQKMGKFGPNSRAADWFMGSVWKPLLLFRLAFPIRAITEETLAWVARSGGTAPIKHWLANPLRDPSIDPLTELPWMLHPIAAFTRKAEQVTGRYNYKHEFYRKVLERSGMEDLADSPGFIKQIAHRGGRDAKTILNDDQYHEYQKWHRRMTTGRGKIPFDSEHSTTFALLSAFRMNLAESIDLFYLDGFSAAFKNAYRFESFRNADKEAITGASVFSDVGHDADLLHVERKNGTKLSLRTRFGKFSRVENDPDITRSATMFGLMSRDNVLRPVFAVYGWHITPEQAAAFAAAMGVDPNLGVAYVQQMRKAWSALPFNVQRDLLDAHRLAQGSDELRAEVEFALEKLDAAQKYGDNIADQLELAEKWADIPHELRDMVMVDSRQFREGLENVPDYIERRILIDENPETGEQIWQSRQELKKRDPNAILTEEKEARERLIELAETDQDAADKLAERLAIQQWSTPRGQLEWRRISASSSNRTGSLVVNAPLDGHTPVLVPMVPRRDAIKYMQGLRQRSSAGIPLPLAKGTAEREFVEQYAQMNGYETVDEFFHAADNGLIENMESYRPEPFLAMGSVDQETALSMGRQVQASAAKASGMKPGEVSLGYVHVPDNFVGQNMSAGQNDMIVRFGVPGPGNPIHNVQPTHDLRRAQRRELEFDDQIPRFETWDDALDSLLNDPNITDNQIDSIVALKNKTKTPDWDDAAYNRYINDPSIEPPIEVQHQMVFDAMMENKYGRYWRDMIMDKEQRRFAWHDQIQTRSLNHPSNADQLIYQNGIDNIEAMRENARVQLGEVKKIVTKRSGQRHYSLANRVGSGRFDETDMRHVDIGEMVPGAYGPDKYVYDRNLWDKIKEFGFEKVAGGMVRSIIRNPIYREAYQEAFERYAVHSLVAYRNTALRESVRATAGRLGLDNSDRGLDDLFEILDELMLDKRWDRNLAVRSTYDLVDDDYGDEMQGLLKILREHKDPKVAAIRSSFESRVAPLNKKADDLRAEREIMKERGEHAAVDAINDELFEIDLKIAELSDMNEKEMFGYIHGPEYLDGDRAISRLTDWWQNEDRALEKIHMDASKAAYEEAVRYIDDPMIRSQMGDKLRNLVPFYFAEEQFMKRWARIIVEHDLVAVERMQNLFHGIEAAGFVQEDQYGKTYILPGSEFVSKAISPMTNLFFGNMQGGIKPMMTASLQQSIPGFDGPQFSVSPLVSIPLGTITDHFPWFKNELEGVEEFLLTPRGVDKTIPEQVLPAAFTRLITAAGGMNDEQLTKSTLSAMQQLYAAELAYQARPDADPEKFWRYWPSPDSTAREINQFQDRVKNWAHNIYAVRAIYGFVSPGAPSIEFKGDLTDEFRSYLEGAGDFAEAVNNFVILHPGATPYTVFQSETESGASMPASRKAYNWMRENEQLLKDNRFAGPWLIPKDEEGTSSDYFSKAFDWQLAQGHRELRLPNEYYDELIFSADSRAYFNTQDDHETRIDEAEKAGDFQTAGELKAQWKFYRDTYFTQHPLFKEMLTDPVRQQRRTKIISEMDRLIGPGGPLSDRPEYAGQRALLNIWDWYLTEKSRWSISSTAYARAQAKRVKNEAYVRMNRYTTDVNPGVRSLFFRVFRPEFQLNDIEQAEAEQMVTDSGYRLVDDELMAELVGGN